MRRLAFLEAWLQLTVAILAALEAGAQLALGPGTLPAVAVFGVTALVCGILGGQTYDRASQL